MAGISREFSTVSLILHLLRTAPQFASSVAGAFPDGEPDPLYVFACEHRVSRPNIPSVSVFHPGASCPFFLNDLQRN